MRCPHEISLTANRELAEHGHALAESRGYRQRGRFNLLRVLLEFAMEGEIKGVRVRQLKPEEGSEWMFRTR